MIKAAGLFILSIRKIQTISSAAANSIGASNCRQPHADILQKWCIIALGAYNKRPYSESECSGYVEELMGAKITNKAHFWFAGFGILTSMLLVLSACSGPGNGLEKGSSESLYVAVGNRGKIWITESGVAWADAGVGGDDLLAVACGNDRFVAVGATGQIWWSYDGHPGTWQNGGSLGVSLHGVAYGNGRFIAVGTAGQAFWSPDGTAGSWTAGGPGGCDLHSITFGEGRFVAVGNTGTAHWSINGECGSWTSTGPGGANLYGVTYGNGHFVAVGVGGAAWWSLDGDAWISSCCPGSDLYSISFGYGRFIAVGQSGRLISSPDGAGAWIEEFYGFDLFEAASRGPYGRFITVGAMGQGLRSQEGMEGTWIDASPGGAEDIHGIACRP